MPVNYKIFENGDYVYARATGVLTLETIIAHERKIKQDSKIQIGFKELFDVREIAKSELTKEGLQKIIQEIISGGENIQRSKLAIVVSSGESFDRAKYFEKAVPLARENVIVFNMLETAKIWLGVDKPDN